MDPRELEFNGDDFETTELHLTEEDALEIARQVSSWEAN